MESSDEALTVDKRMSRINRILLVVRDILENPQYTDFIELYSASSKIQI